MDIMFVLKQIRDDGDNTNLKHLILVAIFAALFVATLTLAATCAAHHEGTDEDITTETTTPSGN